MTLKQLKKLVQVASDQKGGWESYRAREKALGELLHYMPKLLRIADLAQVLLDNYGGEARESDLDDLSEALTALEGK